MTEFFLMLLMGSNLLLSMLIFILIGRPRLIFPMIIRLFGLWEAYTLGTLSEADQLKILHLAKRLGYLGLIVLFFWSVFCGMMLRIFTA